MLAPNCSNGNSNDDNVHFDKRQFFTVKSPNNKGRNAANNTLKRNFPALMFHQQNRCCCMQIRKSQALSSHRNSSMFDRMLPTRLTSSLARLLARCMFGWQSEAILCCTNIICAAQCPHSFVFNHDAPCTAQLTMATAIRYKTVGKAEHWQRCHGDMSCLWT